MNREISGSRASHGSYVQLNTFDEKENDLDQNHLAFPTTAPYERCICSRRDTILVVVVLLLAFILITTSLALGLPKIHENRLQYLDTSFPVSPSPLQTFDSAVVVTDGQNCAPIGKKILEDGGSAVDSAIATLFCESVVNPQSMGLGGGFLMTVYIKSNRSSYVIDARETAPLKATKGMFLGNKTWSQEGGLSIAVPGELRGYKLAHEKFGKLPWRNLIDPSINLCNSGFKVTHHLADKLQRLKARILADDSMKEEFLNNQTNDLYKKGEVMTREHYAKTLEKIATSGPDVLYTGEWQKQFVQDIANCGGIITEEDLASYQPKLKPSVQLSLGETGNLTLHTVPPPGSGLILSLILNILSYYNMTGESFKEVSMATLQYHRMMEAFKFAFAHRTRLGDDSYVNMSQVISNLKSLSYAKSIFESISDGKTFPPSHYKPEMVDANDAGTSHVSVLSSNGDAVSVTSTINTYFGSLCRSPLTGIILNNAMDDFSSPNITNYFGVPPSPANEIEPGKRPLSSMCPTIITEDNEGGSVKMVVGGAGGTRIITASAQGIIQALWLLKDIKEVTDAPRLHHQLFPNVIQYEKTFPKIYLDKLKAYGHTVQPESQDSIFFGIVRDGGKLKTNVDFRKEGSADGL